MLKIADLFEALSQLAETDNGQDAGDEDVDDADDVSWPVAFLDQWRFLTSGDVLACLSGSVTCAETWM